MDSKCSFVLYTEYLEHIALLTMEQRGLLFTAILTYVAGYDPPVMDGTTQMAFSFIRSRLDRDGAAYADKIKKRSDAGKQGGRPKANESNEKQKKQKKQMLFLKSKRKQMKATKSKKTLIMYLYLLMIIIKKHCANLLMQMHCLSDCGRCIR